MMQSRLFRALLAIAIITLTAGLTVIVIEEFRQGVECAIGHRSQCWCHNGGRCVTWAPLNVCGQGGARQSDVTGAP